MFDCTFQGILPAICNDLAKWKNTDVSTWSPTSLVFIIQKKTLLVVTSKNRESRDTLLENSVLEKLPGPKKERTILPPVIFQELLLNFWGSKTFKSSSPHISSFGVLETSSPGISQNTSGRGELSVVDLALNQSLGTICFFVSEDVFRGRFCNLVTGGFFCQPFRN